MMEKNAREEVVRHLIYLQGHEWKGVAIGKWKTLEMSILNTKKAKM